MTREGAKHLHPLIKAFAEGKTIECRVAEKWRVVQNPSWDEVSEYRVKPEPREFFIEVPRVNMDRNAVWASQRPDGAEIIRRTHGGTDLPIIKVREVLD